MLPVLITAVVLMLWMFLVPQWCSAVEAFFEFFGVESCCRVPHPLVAAVCFGGPWVGGVIVWLISWWLLS